MPADDSPAEPLTILIAGAGIGGLATAIALRQQGHNVRLFEQSRLAQETGAAIHLTPNCNGLIRRLGLIPESIGGVHCRAIVNRTPAGDIVRRSDVSQTAKQWGNAWQLVHRAHLHTALKEIALTKEGNGSAVLLTSKRVTGVNPTKGQVSFEGGEVVHGDLVIGADGVHSRTRQFIPGGDLQPFDSGKSAFRFLIPTALLAADPMCADIVAQPGELTMWVADDRRLVMYPCVNETLQNFVAIHPSTESASEFQEGAGWQETGSKVRLLQVFDSFGPSVKAILQKVDESGLKLWQLLDMAQMPSFAHERLAVMGDAAHPFLPNQAQGGGQAIEDGVSLATMLPLGTLKSAVPQRLRLYERCRYTRASKIQEDTRIIGMDASKVKPGMKRVEWLDFVAYNFGHDEAEASTALLQEHLSKEKENQ